MLTGSFFKGHAQKARVASASAVPAVAGRGSTLRLMIFVRNRRPGPHHFQKKAKHDFFPKVNLRHSKDSFVSGLGLGRVIAELSKCASTRSPLFPFGIRIDVW